MKKRLNNILYKYIITKCNRTTAQRNSEIALDDLLRKGAYFEAMNVLMSSLVFDFEAVGSRFDVLTYNLFGLEITGDSI